MMNTKRISSLTTIRIILNILFWVISFVLDIATLSTEYHNVSGPVAGGRHMTLGGDFDPFFSLPAPYYLISLSSLLLLATTMYTNNLLLIPRLLKRKKYLAYAGVAILLLVTASFVSAGWIKALQYLLPELPVKDIFFGKLPAKANPDLFTQFFLHYSQMLVVFTVLWHLYDYAAQRKKLAEAEQKQAQTELNFLKNQINPHFLFNNLNNLYALAIKKSDNTPAAILQLSALLRYLLYDSNTPQVSFEKEKEIIAAYTELERLRLSDNSNLRLSINADNNYSIPPLLWLPVLENMFKHGVHTMHGGGYGEFIFNISNNWLQLYSRNRIDPNYEHKDAGGIGFHNLEKRLQLLYEGKHRFERRVENDHYIVDLSIDLA